MMSYKVARQSRDGEGHPDHAAALAGLTPPAAKRRRNLGQRPTSLILKFSAKRSLEGRTINPGKSPKTWPRRRIPPVARGLCGLTTFTGHPAGVSSRMRRGVQPPIRPIVSTMWGNIDSRLLRPRAWPKPAAALRIGRAERDCPVDSCLAPLSVSSTSIDAWSTPLAAPRKVRMTADSINRALIFWYRWPASSTFRAMLQRM
jgi:hypothetical protein